MKKKQKTSNKKHSKNVLKGEEIILPELKKEAESKNTSPKKKPKKKIFYFLILIIFFILFIYGSVNIGLWLKDNKKVNEQLDIINSVIEVVEIHDEDNKNVEIINEPPKEENKPNPYWDYIKLPLMNVDFSKLKDINSDTVGYLKVNGTNINYPVVQTDNNEFYLTHDFNKNKNSAGWVFLDYRNDINNLQDNTIIYAHGRKNTTMFGSLKNILESKWYENTDNHVIYLSTDQENTLWQVISIYIIPEETYYLTSEFGTVESKQKFIDTILERSEINFNASVDVNDKFLTLSTCYNHVNRVVLHAKLIKKAVRE